MSHFNFGNFLVDESNHDAFQICQDVADLVPLSPLPVLIVGDEGCGKSHLLYSIVNRLRAGTAKTGLALVTANAFPNQVRGLIGDPSPVAKAKSAVLLIDQLEKFHENVEELEGVVQIFLDHGHYVVAASSIHPGRLRDLPENLRHTFESGTIVTIKPTASTPQIERIRQQIRTENQEELNRAAKEIEELRMLLKEVTGGKKSGSNPAETAELKVAADQLQNALTDAEQARERAEADLEAAIAERDALMLRETEALAEAEARHQAELSPLRDRLVESETRVGELDVRIEVLTAEAADAKGALEQGEKDREELNAQIAALKAELEDTSNPDQSLVSEVESLRSQLAASEDAREAERDRLDAEQADAYARTQDELSELQSNHARLQEDMEALRESKEGEVSGLRAELERFHSERTHFEEEANRKAEEREHELQSLRDTLVARGAELEEMRAQAAEVESARANLEELEGLRSELEATRERLAEQTAQHAEERDGLAQELGEVRADHDRLLQRVSELESKATTAEQDRDAAIAAREEALERAEHVLDQVEANRVRMAEVSEHQQARIADLERRLAAAEAANNAESIEVLEQRLTQAEHTAEERAQALEAVREQMQSLEDALEEARSRRDTDVDASRREASEAIEQLDRTQRQYDEAQSALELAQHRVRSLEGDLNALQAEAAAQVARANTQAGETESRLARILSAFETAYAENRALREELGDPNGSAENSAERLMLLAQRLGSSDPVRVARAINPDLRDDLFDDDPSI